jgi:Type II secretion system (T2SS), protein E, N-terminal domain
MSRVGEVLIHEGAVSSAGLRRALTFQRYGGQGLRLGTILVGWNLADEEVLLRALSEHHNRLAVPWSDLSRAAPETVALLPADIAEQVRAIPFREELRGIIVAFSNPSDLTAVDRVAQVMKRRVIPAVALEIRILQAQALFYGTGIPPDHLPILIKLRDAPEKLPWLPRPSISAGLVIPIAPETVESDSVEELVEESVQEMRPKEDLLEAPAEGAPPPRAIPPASLADQTRPIAVRRPPVPAPQGAERSDAASGFWLEDDTVAQGYEEVVEVSDDVPEDLTELETPTPLPAEPAVYLPRPGREQVAQAVLDALLRDMPRALVFGADKNHLFGVYGRGAGVLSSEVQRIHLPPADGSILQKVYESREPHFGRPVEEFWPAPLAMLLGLDPPPCAVFPLENLKGLVGLLYADRGGSPMLEGDFGDLTRAAAFLANALGSSPREN